jgi:selenide,water dikinase
LALSSLHAVWCCGGTVKLTMHAQQPQELVLLGGGHAHVEVLRQWKHKPVPGVKLTLVTRTLQTPYS